MTKQSKLLFQNNTDDGFIEVWEKTPLRWLSIDSIEQTRINIEQPEQLASSVHRHFLAILLFIETPEKVLLGGLGGGALARYLHNRQPQISGDAVEVNETIAELAKDYFYFPKKQWRIVRGDFHQWKGDNYDLMIVDIAESELTPAWLCTKETLLQLKSQLSQRGVLAINLLVNDASSFTRALSQIRSVFNRQTLCLSIPAHKNIIVFAFKQPPASHLINELDTRLENLTASWGLEFSVFLEQLKKDNPRGSGVF